MANNNFWDRDPAQGITPMQLTPRADSLTYRPFANFSHPNRPSGSAVLALFSSETFPAGLPHETVLAAREASGLESFATPKPLWMLTDI